MIISQVLFKIYPEGSAQRKMGNNEDFDKLIFFTKNLSYDKKALSLDKVKERIISTVIPLIENPEDIVFF